MELAVPDPNLEAACCGGTILSASNVGLAAPTGTAVTAYTTLGTLTAGTYGYRVSQYNQYGETPAGTEVTVVLAGSTASALVSGMSLAAGGLGWRFYGRTIGGEQLLGQMIGIGTQATSAASGTGSVASLSVTALTAPIPAGYTFTITGDTNTPKIVWTTLAEASVGAVTLLVSPSQSVGTTIAAANLVPCFQDTGAITPSGMFIATGATDMTVGPGTGVGYAHPALGVVGNPNGVSLEFFEKRIISGYQATDYPYYRIVLPRVANMVIEARDVTNAPYQTLMTGQAFQNPNFGTGPFGDWQFASTLYAMRAVCGAQIVPTAGVTGIAALA